MGVEQMVDYVVDVVGTGVLVGILLATLAVAGSLILSK